jgi:hypothetical protein
VKFLFDSEDLMETILAVKNPMLKISTTDRYLGSIKLAVSVPEYVELQRRYQELTCSYSQLGLDDLHASGLGMKLIAHRHEEAEFIISHGASILDARKFMKRGVPLSLRYKIWRIACGLSEKNLLVEDQQFQLLRYDVDRYDLLSDELFMHDIQTVLDDPRFFVFEEELKEVIFCFSRDTNIRQQSIYEVHAPLLNHMAPLSGTGGNVNNLNAKDPSLNENSLSAPPCGVQPFLGFATYFAPLCYIFRSKSSLYQVSKYFWCRLWCRLNVISADPDTLLPICKTFECLLIRSHPKLFMHLLNLGVTPIKIAFPWIQLAFVGFLEMDQLLHLWERVIGKYIIFFLFVRSVV